MGQMTEMSQQKITTDLDTFIAGIGIIKNSMTPEKQFKHSNLKSTM